MGAFRPTPHGETVMPILTGIQRAYRDLARKDPLAPVAAYEARHRDRGRPSVEYADLAAAESHFNALELELRSAEGVALPTEWIGVQDTEESRRFAEQHRADFPELFAAQEAQDELNASLLRDMELMDEELVEPDVSDAEWEADEDRGELPRYQILAQLKDPL